VVPGSGEAQRVSVGIDESGESDFSRNHHGVAVEHHSPRFQRPARGAHVLDADVQNDRPAAFRRGSVAESDLETGNVRCDVGELQIVPPLGEREAEYLRVEGHRPVHVGHANLDEELGAVPDGRGSAVLTAGRCHGSHDEPHG
jgi:hypothetical protein